jgi:hypothetical protein
VWWTLFVAGKLIDKWNGYDGDAKLGVLQRSSFDVEILPLCRIK